MGFEIQMDITNLSKSVDQTWLLQKNLQKVAIVVFTDQQFKLKERIKWRISKSCSRTAGDHAHRHSCPDNSCKDLCMKTGGITQRVFSFFLVCSHKKVNVYNFKI